MTLANWVTMSQQLAIKFGDRFNFFNFIVYRDGYSRPLSAWHFPTDEFKLKNIA